MGASSLLAAEVVIGPIAISPQSSTYGQTLDSEARIYEEDGRLEVSYIQDSDYAYECADLFFGTRIEVHGDGWPLWLKWDGDPDTYVADPYLDIQHTLDVDGFDCLWTVPGLLADESGVEALLRVHVRIGIPPYTNWLLADLEPVFVPIPPPPPPVRRTPSGGTGGGGGNTGGGSPPRKGCKGTATCGDAYAGKWDIPDGCPGITSWRMEAGRRRGLVSTAACGTSCEGYENAAWMPDLHTAEVMLWTPCPPTEGSLRKRSRRRRREDCPMGRFRAATGRSALNEN